MKKLFSNLAIANALRYIYQRRVEGKRQLERIDKLSAERSMLHATTSPSHPTPKNAKYQFYRLLKDHKVSNSKHYDALLNSSAHLRQLEEVLNPNLLQTCKRIAFNQNTQYDKDTYLQRISEYPPFEELLHRDQETKLEIALITAFLTIVSSTNNFTVEELF